MAKNPQKKIEVVEKMAINEIGEVLKSRASINTKISCIVEICKVYNENISLHVYEAIRITS